MKDEPPPLQASPSLEKIVRRCLAKQPSGRYQTMSEVKTALEQVFEEKATGSSAEPQPSIAVLPFVNMSGDKEQEYFSDGLAEEIINALTQIPGLKVIARTSAFAFKGKQEDITQDRRGAARNHNPRRERAKSGKSDPRYSAVDRLLPMEAISGRSAMTGK